MPQDGGEDGPVGPDQGIHGGGHRAEEPHPIEPGGGLELEQLRREHRHEGEGDDERHDDGERDRQEKLAEQERRQARDEEKRHDGGEVRDGRCDDRRRDLAGPRVRRLHRVRVLPLVAVDVLQHDDGVVDQHPDAQGEPAERHDVEREARHAHQRHAAEDRDRDRRTDDQRPPHRAKEEEDDEHRQTPAQSRRLSDAAHRRTDEEGLVLSDAGGHVGREEAVALEPRQDAVAAVDDLHGVRIGLLGDGDLHGRLSVEAGEDPVVEVSVADVRDIGQGDVAPTAGQGEADGRDIRG